MKIFLAAAGFWLICNGSLVLFLAYVAWRDRRRESRYQRSFEYALLDLGYDRNEVPAWLN